MLPLPTAARHASRAHHGIGRAAAAGQSRSSQERLARASCCAPAKPALVAALPAPPCPGNGPGCALTNAGCARCSLRATAAGGPACRSVELGGPLGSPAPACCTTAPAASGCGPAPSASAAPAGWACARLPSPRLNPCKVVYTGTGGAAAAEGLPVAMVRAPAAAETPHHQPCQLVCKQQEHSFCAHREAAAHVAACWQVLYQSQLPWRAAPIAVPACRWAHPWQWRGQRWRRGGALPPGPSSQRNFACMQQWQAVDAGLAMQAGDAACGSDVRL
jgi:hypothetical protein